MTDYGLFGIVVGMLRGLLEEGLATLLRRRHITFSRLIALVSLQEHAFITLRMLSRPGIKVFAILISGLPADQLLRLPYSTRLRLGQDLWQIKSSQPV